MGVKSFYWKKERNILPLFLLLWWNSQKWLFLFRFWFFSKWVVWWALRLSNNSWKQTRWLDCWGLGSNDVFGRRRYLQREFNDTHCCCYLALSSLWFNCFLQDICKTQKRSWKYQRGYIGGTFCFNMLSIHLFRLWRIARCFSLSKLISFWCRINEIPELFVIGKPDMTIIAFGSTALDIFEVNDIMSSKGWHLNALQKPSRWAFSKNIIFGLHLMSTPLFVRECWIAPNF